VDRRVAKSWQNRAVRNVAAAQVLIDLKAEHLASGGCWGQAEGRAPWVGRAWGAVRGAGGGWRACLWERGGLNSTRLSSDAPHQPCPPSRGCSTSCPQIPSTSWATAACSPPAPHPPPPPALRTTGGPRGVEQKALKEIAKRHLEGDDTFYIVDLGNATRLYKVGAGPRRAAVLPACAARARGGAGAACLCCACAGNCCLPVLYVRRELLPACAARAQGGAARP